MVDAQGVTHFGSEPPSGQTVESVNTNTFQPQLPEKKRQHNWLQRLNKPALKRKHKLIVKFASKSQQKQLHLKKYCASVRHNLAQLENNPRILAEVDGKPTRLNEEERQSRISEMKQAILERCTTIQ